MIRTSTRSAVNRPSMSGVAPSHSQRPGAIYLATRCPFCQSQIALADGNSATSVCPNCGLRFTVESPQRSGKGTSPQMAATSGQTARRASRMLLPAALVAMASAATAVVGWVLLH